MAYLGGTGSGSLMNLQSSSQTGLHGCQCLAVIEGSGSKFTQVVVSRPWVLSSCWSDNAASQYMVLSTLLPYSMAVGFPWVE